MWIGLFLQINKTSANFFLPIKRCIDELSMFVLYKWQRNANLMSSTHFIHCNILSIYQHVHHSKVPGQTVWPHVPFVTECYISMDKQFSHRHLKHFVDKMGGQTVCPHYLFVQTLCRQGGWTNSLPTLVCPNTLYTRWVEKLFVHTL